MNAQGVNLSNCDREPIHQLGRIQAFGALIAVNADWFAAHLSTNLEDIFGAGRTLEIGDRLSSLFARPALDELRSSAAALSGKDQVERLCLHRLVEHNLPEPLGSHPLPNRCQFGGLLDDLAEIGG